MREIVATLALDYSPFELKETPIINHLVRLRNNIAHGGGLPVGANDYGVLHTDIIVLMSEYKDQVQDAAYKDGHLR